MDKERLILYVDQYVMVMMNKFPYVNGHLLVAPFRHVPEFEELTDEEILRLGKMVKKSISILREFMKPDGFNIGINLGKVAGAGVEEHMHYHIVPRWYGDTNFMTVLDDVRVIPEHIQVTYDKLYDFYKSIRKEDES
jgi:ATP adenylyltransferase